MKKLRLLLVDDHAVVREGLRSLLHDESTAWPPWRRLTACAPIS
jgi:DNA-binding NarL/FixJ family response regulator